VQSSLLTKSTIKQYIPPPFVDSESVLTGYNHETHISAQRNQEKAHPRLPGAHAHSRWARRDQREASQGTRQAQRLTCPVVHHECTCGQTFGRSHRLLKSAEFRHVFRQRRRIASRVASIHLSRNGLEHPRLGLTVSRKVSRKAVQRNRIKRVVREYFRKNQVIKGGTDLVFTAFPGCEQLTNEALNQALEILWQRAAQRCEG
jgi:ribonuclease P protein component